jgi:hypothetical protein
MHKLALLLAITLFAGIGQSADPKPVEPNAIGVVFLLDATNQVLKPLSNET